MKKTLIALSIAMYSIMTPQAEARSLEKILTECGIGGILFKEVPALAALSNVIWDLGTTATLSDLSSKEGCKGKSAKIAMLIGHTYDNLETEIAEGKGKHINTLASLSDKSTSEIREDFSKVVASKEYSSMNKIEKADSLFQITAE
ncbi:MAG: DUF3015 family protein [Sulfurovum sp.]|nr:DUF3015 family protein [Sulfurovum sp.]